MNGKITVVSGPGRNKWLMKQRIIMDNTVVVDYDECTAQHFMRRRNEHEANSATIMSIKQLALLNNEENKNVLVLIENIETPFTLVLKYLAYKRLYISENMEETTYKDLSKN